MFWQPGFQLLLHAYHHDITLEDIIRKGTNCEKQCVYRGCLNWWLSLFLLEHRGVTTLQYKDTRESQLLYTREWQNWMCRKSKVVLYTGDLRLSCVLHTRESWLPGFLCTLELIDSLCNPCSPCYSLWSNTFAKKCLMLLITFQIHKIYVWKIDLAHIFLIDSPVYRTLGSEFKIWISQWKIFKIWNGPRISLGGPGGAVQWKK